MRNNTFLALIGTSVLVWAGLGVCQTAQITSVSGPCPKPAPIDLSPRTWKHGQDEQRAFEAITAAKEASNRIAQAGQFVSRYPDSDYYGFALVTKLLSEAQINDQTGQLNTARQLIESKTVLAGARLLAYAVIAD